MFNYKDCECGVCQKPLKDSDDIVVCPECGAPYHRECYVQSGNCVHSSKHASGFEYKTPAALKRAEDAKHHEESLIKSSSEGVLCPNCKATNDADKIFCEKCGNPLHAGKQEQGPNPFVDNMPPPNYFGMPVINPTDEIDGISAKDWAEYIGSSAPYYLYQFKSMDIQHRKTGICWSALLFAPVYFIYRKVWSWGIISALLSILQSVPYFLYMMTKAGLPFAATLNPNLLANLTNVASLLGTVLQLAWGLFAIYLFRKSAATRIKKIKSSAGSEEIYHASLKRACGPSIAAVVIFFVALFVITGFVTNNLIGAENVLKMLNSTLQ